MNSLNLADLTTSAGVAKKATKVMTPEIKQGSCVHVFCLNSTDDRDLFDMQWLAYRTSHGIEGSVGLRKFIVAWMLADKENNRLVCSGDEENRVKPDFITAMNELSNLPVPVATRVFEKARHNLGMSQAEADRLEKNSETTPSVDGSGSKPKRQASAAKSGSASSKTKKS